MRWKNILPVVLTLAVSVSAMLPARAQLVNDTATNTLIGVTNTLLGDLIVGTNGSFTTLILSNAARVADTNGVIGLGLTSDSNLVFLTGTNTVWSNTGSLTVGDSGSFNQLVISNRATVLASNSFIGSNATSLSNIVTVTGTNSTWTNSGFLNIGDDGAFNLLVITNGARVFSAASTLAASAAGSNNIVRIGGTNSLWQMSGALTVGSNSPNNQVFVTDGARMASGSAVLGFTGAGDNNLVTIAGTNSIWTNSGTLVIGRAGTGNRLVVSNGATVSSVGTATLGSVGGGVGNIVTVTDTNSLWTNRGALVIGGAAGNNQVNLTNGGRLSMGTGGISLGNTLGSVNNVLLVSDAGSSVRTTNIIEIGVLSGNNRLSVTNGATLSAGSIVVGSDDTTAPNLFFIGSNATSVSVSNSQTNAALHVKNGSLTIDGGTVTADQFFLTNSLGSIAFNYGTLITRGGSVVGNGSVFVVGNGTTGLPASWDVRTNLTPLTTLDADLQVGELSAGNSSLLITNGGVLSQSPGFSTVIGQSPFASNNFVVVAGNGSAWNVDTLTVGLNGFGNQIVISNGARAATVNVTIGSAADTNQVTVTGTGSAWSNSATLVVGGGGSINSLLITNTGRVDTASGFIGQASSGNSLTVGGVGSRWNSTNALNIGFDGNDNSLTVVGGATVSASNTVVGGLISALSTKVLIADVGSLFTNLAELRVGDSGSDSQVVVSNGARIVNSNSFIGFAIPASNNTVLITGSGSLWTNRGLLTVGRAGARNTLVVSNAGRVTSIGGVIGANGGGNNNTIVVTDAGSVWTNSGPLSVGVVGNVNRLFVTNGGVVFSASGAVGGAGVSAGNSVLISGTGSSWTTTTTNTTTVGSSTALNSLTVSDGGRFSAAALVAGLAAEGVNNTVTVTGPGAVLVATNSLLLGVQDVNNRLFVTNGGALFTAQSSLGSLGTNTNTLGNFAFVSGSGSLWSNTQSLTIGGTGGGNQVVIAENGLLRVGTNILLGQSASSASNLLFVAGGTVAVSNAAISGTLDVRNGGATLSGGAITVDRLLLTNAAGVSNQGGSFTFNGGTLITRGASISNGLDFVVGAVANGGPAIWDVRTGAGTAALGAGFILGSNAGTATLLITNGQSLLVAGSSRMGVGLASSNNVALISGAGSLWRSADSLTVGEFGQTNTLTVTNSGAVFAGTNLIVGANTNALGSLLFVAGGTVTASNALVTATLDIRNGAMTLNTGTVNVDRLVVTNGTNGTLNFNGGTLITRGGFISSNQTFTVGLSNSTPAIWDLRNGGGAMVVASNLIIGQGVSGSQLLITNGQTLQVLSPDFGSGTASSSILGRSTASNNLAVVAGTGSFWSNAFNLSVGADTSGNNLVISNGARVENAAGYLGFQASSFSNLAIVTGAGSLWTNRNDLNVGNAGAANRLIVTNSGAVSARGGLVIGLNASSTNNRVIVSGGTLNVQDGFGLAVFDLIRGTNQFDGGTMNLDILRMTNTAGIFAFNAGTAAVRSATISNGFVFTVGNGTSNANYRLTGGTNSFANNLVISSNAFLSGTGTVIGNVTNFGTVAAGASAGALNITGNLSLKTNANMTFEIGGLIATNQYDRVNVSSLVEFVGNLSLTLLNNFLPKATDSFTIMTFGSSSGTFANTTNNARFNFTNGLASFRVTYTATNLILSQAAYLDSDGDGQGDLAEQLAGTSTNNSRDFLTFTSITFAGATNVVLQWQSVTNIAYRVEFSTNLTSAWNAIVGPVFTNPATNRTQWIDNGTLTVPLTNATRRFYRVGLQ